MGRSCTTDINSSSDHNNAKQFFWNSGIVIPTLDQSAPSFNLLDRCNIRLHKQLSGVAHYKHRTLEARKTKLNWLGTALLADFSPYAVDIIRWSPFLSYSHFMPHPHWMQAAENNARQQSYYLKTSFLPFTAVCSIYETVSQIVVCTCRHLLCYYMVLEYYLTIPKIAFPKKQHSSTHTPTPLPSDIWVIWIRMHDT